MSIVRGIDHVALTVPNIETATQFFRDAFDAQLIYDLHSKNNPPLKGNKTEKMLGLKKGTELVQMRLLSIGKSASIELFEYKSQSQKASAKTYDFGLQHIALYTDDIDATALRFEKAGGSLYTDINQIFGKIEGVDEHNRFVYGETPWGTVIELVTYPSGINYPDYSEQKRFTPNN